MKFLIIAFLLAGCSKHIPLYKAGQCINLGLIVMKIVKVTESHYITEVDMMGLIKQKAKHTFKEFDEGVEEDGLVVENCEEE